MCAAGQTVEAALGHRPAAFFRHLGLQGLGTVAQFQGQALIVLLQSPQLRGALQGQQQLVRLPGLEQILPDAGFIDAGDDVFRIGITRENNAHGIRPADSHLTEEFHARSPRHALVAEQDLDKLAFHHLPRRLGGRRGEDLEILFQGAAQGFQRTDFVIDD